MRYYVLCWFFPVFNGLRHRCIGLSSHRRRRHRLSKIEQVRATCVQECRVHSHRTSIKNSCASLSDQRPAEWRFLFKTSRVSNANTRCITCVSPICCCFSIMAFPQFLDIKFLLLCKYHSNWLSTWHCIHRYTRFYYPSVSALFNWFKVRLKVRNNKASSDVSPLANRDQFAYITSSATSHRFCPDSFQKPEHIFYTTPKIEHLYTSKQGMFGANGNISPRTRRDLSETSEIRKWDGSVCFCELIFGN